MAQPVVKLHEKSQLVVDRGWQAKALGEASSTPTPL